MDSEFLSDIELFYTKPLNIKDDELSVDGDDFRHITKVMRHTLGNELFVTDGIGKIFRGKITSISKNNLKLKADSVLSYFNKFERVYFCLPKLKNPQRFEFMLEKCTEMGITNFIVFESARTVAKGNKKERWEKIALAAMKQSLRSFLPEIQTAEDISQIMKSSGRKIVFDQKAETGFGDFSAEKNENYYFVFGPEGGLTEDEINLFENGNRFRLAGNRLRSETAVIKCASVLTL